MGFLSEGRHTGLTVSLGDPSGPHPEKTGELVGLRQCWAKSSTSLNETPMWRTSAYTVRLASPNTRSHTPGYGRQYCKQSPNQPCHRPMRDPSPGGTASVSCRYAAASCVSPAPVHQSEGTIISLSHLWEAWKLSLLGQILKWASWVLTNLSGPVPSHGPQGVFTACVSPWNRKSLLLLNGYPPFPKSSYKRTQKTPGTCCRQNI